MIIIEFSGWLEVEPSKIVFQSTVGECKNISGTEWLKLAPSEQNSYILQSLANAMEESDELEYVDLNIIETE